MIRELRVEDIPAVIRLARMMHTEGAFAFLDFSTEKMARLFFHCVESDDHLCLVAEKDGELVGGYMAYITPYYFGNDLLAQELALFIAPEYRGGSLAVKMTKRYMKWASDRGVKEIMAGASMGIKSDKVRSLYERLGFETIGFIFKKRI